MEDNQEQYFNQAPIIENPLEASYHVYGMQQNSDVVFDFLQGERGYYWDKSTKKYEKFVGVEENFNELGLKEIYNILHSVVNRSNVLAALKESQINKIMERTMITLVKSMTRNKKRWNLKENVRSSIVENCKNQMLMFLSKTKDGTAATLFYGSAGFNEGHAHKDDMDVSANQQLRG